MVTQPPSPSSNRLAQAIRDALHCGRSSCPCAKASGGKTHCPVHDGQSASLSVRERDGKVLLKCFSGCDQQVVIDGLRAKGLWREPTAKKKAPGKHIVATYDYQQGDGQVLFQVVRYEPKAFRQRRPNGTGWHWDLEGVSLVPYHLPILLAADPKATVFISEGEKDAEALSHAGLVATTAPMGAGKWPDSFAPYFVARRVVILPDADEPGRQHGQLVAASLYGVAAEVKVLDLPGAKDAAEWFGLGHTAAELDDLARAAELWNPTWGTLADLLEQVAQFLRAFVVMSEHQASAAALWTAHTYTYRASDTTPYLSLRSAEKRSGKSRLLEVLDLLAHEPLRTENISVAALAHSLDGGCTLLLDEVDTIFKATGGGETQEMLRGVLDAGYRAGGYYVRMAGQGASMHPQRFDCFGPKALAGIGRLPGTLDDRSIIIILKRRIRSETMRRLRMREAREEAAPMCERLAAWGANAFPPLQAARPAIPDELDDRAQDSWEPLLAIADLAGGEWPTRARAAALDLSAGMDIEDDTAGVRLLADLQTIFGDAGAKSTVDLLSDLNALDDAAWPGFHKGAGIKARDLGRLLRPYGIRSTTIRVGMVTPKGYARSGFEDCWSRYNSLSPEIIRNIRNTDTTQARKLSATKGDFWGNVADNAQARARYDVADVADKNPEEGDAQPNLTSGEAVGDNLCAVCSCPIPEHFDEGEPTPGSCPTCGANLWCKACLGCIHCGQETRA